MIRLNRRKGQWFKIGDDIFIYISHVADKRVELEVSAPKHKILRGELCDRNVSRAAEKVKRKINAD